MNRRHFLIGSVALLGPAARSAAAGTEYPSHSVRIIVPFSPGGAADYLARIIAHELGKRYEQSFVTENRPGASGNIGTSLVAKAIPDGYTLLLGISNMAINMSLYRHRGFDARKDFSPIVIIATLPNIVVVNPLLPVKSIADLIAFAKANPNALVHASTGNGSPGYLAFVAFERLAGVNLLNVIYKGPAEAIPDLLANRTNFMFGNIPGFLPYIKNGKLRPLAVTGTARAAALPDVPTVSESGLPGYVHPDAWYGLMAPARTPTAIVQKLNTTVNKILMEPAFKKLLISNGTEPAGGSIDFFERTLTSDLALYANLIKQMNVPLAN